MDLGGTNLRVMLMEVKTRQHPIKTSQHNFRIPNWAFGGTGEQVRMIESFSLLKCSFAVVQIYCRCIGRISRGEGSCRG